MDLVDMHSSIRFHLDCAIVQKRLSDFSKDLLTHNMNVYIRKWYSSALWYLFFYCCRGILVDLVQARSSLGKLSQLVSGTELRWEDVDFVQWVFLGLSTSSAPPSFYLATSEVQDILLDRIQYLFMFLLFFFCLQVTCSICFLARLQCYVWDDIMSFC